MPKRSLLGAGIALLCASLLISPALARGLVGGHLGGPPVQPPSKQGPVAHLPNPRHAPPVSHSPPYSRVPFAKIHGPRQCYHVCRRLSGTTPDFCAQSCFF